MRRLANTVVVCTSVSEEPGESIPIGLTLSSFTSLSILPASPERPALMFNIGAPSRTLTAIERTRAFCIHVLSGDVQGASVAAVFAGENRDPGGPLRKLGELGYTVASGHGSATKDAGHQGDQWFEGPGVLHVLRCRLLPEPSGGLVKVRDHVVILGEVLEIVPQRGQADPAKLGLVYADRQYRGLGKRLLGPDDSR